jgi:hypothetical protein
VKWERAVLLSTVDAAYRVSDALWPEPTRVVKRRAYVAFNSNSRGDAGEWSTCPFKKVYEHDDWRPVRPKDAVTALGSLAPEGNDADP